MRRLNGAVMVLALATLAFSGACAANRQAGSGTQQDRITNDELSSIEGVRNLWDVVERLRPRWLEARAADRSFGIGTGKPTIVVFQEQMYLGDVTMLHQLAPDIAYDLKWLDGPTASSTLPGLGSQHVAGAIVIYTRPH